MQTRPTTPKGSPGTLFASFLHFDMCFTMWVLLGALGIYITKDLRLNAAQQGLMVAIPTLSGAFFRIIFGLLSDRFGGKRVGVGMLLFLFIPLLLGWLVKVNFPAILGIGLMLGVAGASFSVALPLASRWYTSERQGLVMGIAAAGNVGTVISTFFGPRLATSYGWHGVMGLVMIPLAVVLLIFVFLAKDSPNRPAPSSIGQYLAIMRRGDLWWFCLFYSITFGGFVGLGTFLPIFLHNQYALNPVSAGSLTALAAFLGSTLRPVGGYIADRVGGVRSLSIVLGAVAVLYATTSFLPPLGVMSVLLVAGVALLGTGNGAVFQLVPQRFRAEIGVATGIVGAFGGFGGFFLPTLLGSVKQLSGSYGIGLAVLACIAFTALIVLRLLVTFRETWRFSWKVPVLTPAISE
ncbi:MAG: NarK/NasA family nitrate transporter [Chloroflexi bacterium]|nr:NarK/NasA family nitrate transporter [Ktedonobacteraceae bacterium]MBV9707957.1 NarK/NasA family nitrate transporter [Chloroflexota bacterium]